MLVKTEELNADVLRALGEPQVHQTYCGLDCCVTFEVLEALQSLTQNEEPLLYSFERALQAPALDMMLRGFKIDEYERARGIERTKSELAVLRAQLDELADAVWSRGLNPSSPKQLKAFFYEAMKLPEQWSSFRGERKLSLNRETLEKLDVYLHARPFVALILEARDLAKRLSVLETEISSDGRMRTSYNIGGTNTGRWSSSSDVTGTGTNLQNITPELRRMFVADTGWKLCGIDLEQAESREVGWLCGTLFQDWRYLDACEGGDLHTTTARLIWPNLGWVGEQKQDRVLADTKFYREFSYRDMSKRGGHGCLTEAHEVLTRRGWVPIVDKPKEILCWSEKESFFAPVSNWIDKEYAGDLVSLDGTSLSLEMTADHTVWFHKDQRWPAVTCAAAQLPKRGAIPLGSKYVGGSATLSKETAQLIAAFQCDGNQKSVNRVEFHLYKSRKVARLFALAEKGGYQYDINDKRDTITLHACGWPKHAGAYLLDWPREILEAYVQEHKYWDGHIATTSVSISSVTKSHLEWLQTVGRLVGIGGNISKGYPTGFGSLRYALQQNNRQFADIFSLKERKIWNGIARVFCPTVPTGAFYVRRNGRISVTGNSNYLGTPFTLSRHLKVPTRVMENFQSAYFDAFPSIPRWHRWVAEQLQRSGRLVTPFGRSRQFFGRPNDDATLRKAIAFSPQSSTADRLNLGLWRIWKHIPEVQLLAQVHDAVYVQYPETTDEEKLMPRLLEAVRVELACSTRKFTIPGECKLGFNWGTYSENNPDGLKKFSGKRDDRKRQAVGIGRIL